MTDNVKLIKDAFGRGDPAFIVAQVSGDVDWRHPGGAEIPYGGTYNGPQGVAQFFTRIGESVEVKSWRPAHVLAPRSACSRTRRSSRPRFGVDRPGARHSRGAHEFGTECRAPGNKSPHRIAPAALSFSRSVPGSSAAAD